MDPMAGVDGCGKSRPSPGFDPRIRINPVVFSIVCNRINHIVLGIGLVHDNRPTKSSLCGYLFTPRIFPTPLPVSRRSWPLQYTKTGSRIDLGP